MGEPAAEREHRYMTLAPGEAEAIRDRVRMDADYRQAVADALAAWESGSEQRRIKSRRRGLEGEAQAAHIGSQGRSDG